MLYELFVKIHATSKNKDNPIFDFGIWISQSGVSTRFTDPGGWPPKSRIENHQSQNYYATPTWS
jgi:hypothetical protein